MSDPQENIYDTIVEVADEMAQEGDITTTEEYATIVIELTNEVTRNTYESGN